MKNDIILVGAKTNEMGQKMKAVLEQSMFSVADVCTSGKELLRKESMNKPNLIIMDYDLGDMTGFQITEIVINEQRCSVILLANSIQKDYIEQYFSYPYVVCLLKPLNRQVFINAVEISIKSRKSIQKLEDEIHRLKNDIEARKYIEKAKGLLMKTLQISEEQAYEKLRKQSMDMQLGMKSVAQIIINTMKGE